MLSLGPAFGEETMTLVGSTRRTWEKHTCTNMHTHVSAHTCTHQYTHMQIDVRAHKHSHSVHQQEMFSADSVPRVWDWAQLSWDILHVIPGTSFALFCMYLWYRLVCSPGWLQTHYIAKDDFELLILSPYPVDGIASVHLHTQSVQWGELNSRILLVS